MPTSNYVSSQRRGPATGLNETWFIEIECLRKHRIGAEAIKFKDTVIGERMYHIVGGTGRTATTFIAAVLNELDGVVACHEGYIGSDHDATAALPLVNLENNRAYQDPLFAERVIRDKRSPEQLRAVADRFAARTIVDVAYYNATIAAAILAAYPSTRLVAVIRDAEAFVRSSTQVDGEDEMPVGWPDPDKKLSAREKFIAFGRIRPRKCSDEHRYWEDWSAISRNIWLWRETNLCLLDVKASYPDRVELIDFELLQHDRDEFWRQLLAGLDLSAGPEQINHALAKKFHNRKPEGKQVGPRESWLDTERAQLDEAVRTIRSVWDQWRTQ